MARCPRARSTSSHQARNAGYSLASILVFVSVTVVFTRKTPALDSVVTSYVPNGLDPLDACDVLFTFAPGGNRTVQSSSCVHCA